MTDTARVLRGLRRVLAGRDLDGPGPPPRRWRRIVGLGWPLGVLALIGLAAAATQYLRDTRAVPASVALWLGILSVLPVLIAVRWPLMAWRIAYVGLFLGTVDRLPTETWPWNPVQILAFLVVLGVVALRAPLRVTGWVGLFSLFPIWIFMSDANRWGASLLFLAVLVLGEEVGRRRQAQRALVRQFELSELEQARRAVLEERTRVARELHDVVAHHMSLIAVRAETAPYRLEAVPDRVREEFAAIAGASREALTDMRRILGVLRSDGASPDLAPELSPQPGLADIGDLVAAARRAGVAVSYAPHVEGAAPGAVGHAAYRIVQEALANASRHARGAPVTVEVTGGARNLSLTVTNGPTTAAEPGPDGHGIIGMRERTAAVGGSFTAGRTPGGGYAVAATLPYEPPAASR